MARDFRVFLTLAMGLFGMFRAGAQSTSISPAGMPRVAIVDDRFLSYNVEMVEVTGGRFWKPYAHASSDLFEYRPPIDLSNPRLRTLATALGPAYVRVSGTWANSVYFNDADGPAPERPPAGFNSVLTRAQWKGVVDFARSANARIVTSFAWSPGTRDSSGVWTPEQARQLIDYTKSIGGSIAAAEFVNEPNFAANGAAPARYDAVAYGRDVAVFRRFFKDAAPDALFLGPGSAAEGGAIDAAAVPGRLKTEDLLKATGSAFDVFSYHIYGAVSQRCAAGAPAMGTTAAAALTSDTLFRFEKIHAFYAAFRDHFEPGKPLWVTETADAACGGNPWAATFLDSFRFLNQFARLAQHGVQMVAHNTLAASDYGLLDEKTFAPRPNFWAAVLWRRLMGAVVLDAGVAPSHDLYLYAQCMRGQRGGVTVLAINAASTRAPLNIATRGERYTLTADALESTVVRLNGQQLVSGNDGELPTLGGVATRAGQLTLPPASITFLAFPTVGNVHCR
jgi:heparanase